MVLEMLSHRTPPSCVSQNILTVAEILCPDFKIVKELPSTRFVCGCRSVLSYFTKLMAAYQLAKVDTHLELHHDSTKRRQISIANLIIRIAIEGGFKNVTMKSAILSTNESAVTLTESILRTYKEGQHLLRQWREVTAELFPDRTDLLDLIPHPSELSPSKLAKGGWVMTDTCSPARKLRRLLKAAIADIAKESGMETDEIQIYEGGKQLYLSFSSF